jgi:hypothetical protein
MHIPLIEYLKSIPGFVGIRLEEELPYEVMRSAGELEIRHYSAFTLARTKCSGSYKSASEICFKTLAEFIFGANTDKKVAEMTTPVFMDRTNDGWIMSFYLPESMTSLAPSYPGISVENMPGKTVAAYRFSGVFDEMSMEQSKRKLLDILKAQNLKPESEVWWAQFDQPISLPMTKRNEALVKVQTLS